MTSQETAAFKTEQHTFLVLATTDLFLFFFTLWQLNGGRIGGKKKKKEKKSRGGKRGGRRVRVEGATYGTLDSSRNV